MIKSILSFFILEIICSTCFFPLFVNSSQLTFVPQAIFFVLFNASPWRITKYLFPDFFVFSFNSLIDPITSTLLQSPHFQIGNGDAQYRLREIVQSGAFSIVFKKRPCFKCPGNQLIFLLFLISLSLIACILINQEEIALYKRAVS